MTLVPSQVFRSIDPDGRSRAEEMSRKVAFLGPLWLEDKCTFANGKRPESENCCKPSKARTNRRLNRRCDILPRELLLAVVKREETYPLLRHFPSDHRAYDKRGRKRL
jgi:hypothetical protein